MKTAIFAFILSFSALATIAYKPEVTGAKYDAETDSIVVGVTHGGGCGEHKYELKLVGGCRETYPVQCDLEITDTTDDFCKALLYREASFTLEELGLRDSYFNGAFLTVFGGKAYKDGELVESSASFQLPFTK